MIESENSADPATFRSVKIWDSNNLTLSKLAIEFTAKADTIPTDKIVAITESHNIAIRDSTITGDTMPIDGAPSPVGRAVVAMFSTGVFVESNMIDSVRSGVTLSATNVVISNNTITNIRTTFIGGWTQEAVIENNVFRSTNPINLGGAGDHADIIHLWAKSSAALRDIEIAGNFFSQDEGQAIWGIYIEGSATNGLGAYDVRIHDNVIFNGVAEGVIATALYDSVISDNTLIHAGDGLEGNAPTVRLSRGGARVEIVDNILGKSPITDGLTAAERATLTVGGNVVVDRFDALAANHIEKAFVNPLAPKPELSDLQSLPGGYLDGRDVGAAATRFDATPETLTALALVETRDRAETAYRFDAGLTANAEGFVGATAATFRWSFGDGATAAGKVVDHVYAAVGDYDVVLSVTNAKGESDVFRTRVSVPDPQLLKIGVESGALGDLSSYDSSVSGTASVVTAANGSKVIQLDGGDYVSVARTTARHIYNLDGFAFEIDLQATAGRASAGELFRIHTAIKTSVASDGAVLMVFTNAADETFRLATNPSAVLNGAWHKLAFSYDSATGAAQIRVDGAVIAFGTMSGKTQPLESWGLDIGGRWKQGFTGNIDKLEMRAIDGGPAPAPAPRQVDNPVEPETPAPALESAQPESPSLQPLRLLDFESGDLGGVVIGGARVASENGDHVMVFDGDGDALSLGALSDLDGATKIAFAFDFKPDAITADPARLFWAHTEYGVELLGDTLALRVGLESGAMAQFKAAGGGVEAGQWSRVVVNIDEDAGTASMHLDGLLVVDQQGLDIDVSGPNQWAARLGGAFGEDFDGRIDDLIIDDKPLDPASYDTLIFG